MLVGSIMEELLSKYAFYKKKMSAQVEFRIQQSEVSKIS